MPIFNRAHYGRLRPVLTAIKNHPNLELKIIVGVPAAYGYFFKNILNSRPKSWRLALPWYMVARLRSFWHKDLVFKNDFLAKNLLADKFEIESYVPIFFDGGKSETMAKTVGLGIEVLVKEIKKIKPDIVFVNADRFEMMAVAIAASYLNVPIAHNEGGDVSGTIDESIRHAITKLSHIHFTSTETSRRRVIQMGENPEMVFNVVSPAIDAVAKADFKKRPGVFPGLDMSKPYLMVLAHPVATLSGQENFEIIKNLISVLKELKMPTLLLGSNTDAGSDRVGQTISSWLADEKPDYIFFTKHLHPDDFYKFMNSAACALGNSSSFIREGAYFGTPVVLMGSRQNKREKGDNIIECSHESVQCILDTIKEQLKHGPYKPNLMFGNGQAAAKISKILAEADAKVQKEFYSLPEAV